MPSPAPGPPRGHDTAAAGRTLLAGFSLDMTGEPGVLASARRCIPPGTRVHVGFISGQDPVGRASTAQAIRRAGLVPVPVIAARRLRSEAMFREYLGALQAADASGSVLVVAGDPVRPQGPYPDTASVIGSGLLERYGVRQVSVAGHPAGHPAGDDKALWSALAGKAAALEQRGLGGSVVTQFGFDPDLVLAWLAGARARGVGLPVRVGVPGPASVRQLLSYASRCGVSVSTPAARGYGLSLTGPAATVTPDRFIRALASGYDPQVHGEMQLHLNPFGGFTATTEWASQFRNGRSREVPAVNTERGNGCSMS